MSDSDFQLVLEFDGDTSEHLLRTSSVEDALIESITTGQVDGHDIGGGCMNIFLFCAEPQRCFEEVLARLTELNYLPTAAGYRKTGSEAFVRAWPKGERTPFHLR